MVETESQNIEETLKRYIQAHNIKKICVSLSGGVDSIVLLYALNQVVSKDIFIRAIHINHNLVKDSHSWADFCKKTCDQSQVQIDIHSVKVSTTEGFGIEAAARKARYHTLQKSIQAGEWLMTAHHQDDQLETILLRMARGTGVEGLQGIQNNLSLEEVTFCGPFWVLPKMRYSRMLGKNNWIGWWIPAIRKPISTEIFCG